MVCQNILYYKRQNDANVYCCSKVVNVQNKQENEIVALAAIPKD